MILWVALFILVVAISFVLAVQSMRDFSEVPDKIREYSLFLVRNTAGLNKELISSLVKELKPGAFISLERLFKGTKSALVVFGPKSLLVHHRALDLLELEEYSKVEAEHIFAWEVGVKNTDGTQLFKNMPQLHNHEQFWWQVIISSEFIPQITAVVFGPDIDRRHGLAHHLQNIEKEHVFKLPKAFSNAQLLEFYQKRSLRKDFKNPKLSAEKILRLIQL
jgi:hypothetical protein